jgi:hypothetical protein
MNHKFFYASYDLKIPLKGSNLGINLVRGPFRIEF